MMHPCLLLISTLLAAAAPGFTLPDDCRQCVVGVAADWNQSHATLRCYEKTASGWKAAGPAWPTRLGRDGLAWGAGIHGVPKGEASKKEGDWRSPAGIFAIGGVWSHDPAVKRHPGLFFRKVTSRDLWVEDPASPHYNRHLVLDHEPASPWEKRQQMKQDDPAHALKLFIAHNAPPKVTPGAGSSIFFHIWRAGGTKPTAGCTTMEAARLKTLIAWIDPTRRPVYVLLPKAEYEKYRRSWKLP